MPAPGAVRIDREDRACMDIQPPLETVVLGQESPSINLAFVIQEHAVVTLLTTLILLAQAPVIWIDRLKPQLKTKTCFKSPQTVFKVQGSSGGEGIDQ